MAIMAATGLSKVYTGGGRAVPALEDLNFTVEEGEFLTLIGPSGCGKSTLLRCLAGFDRPTSGQAVLDGRTISGPGADRMMVFQGFDQLFPWLTVRENLAQALRLTRVCPGKAASRALAGTYLDLVGLEAYGDFYPHHLSGGMKQRVAIARALCVRPRVLLMDEPFGSLDALTRATLQQELLRIWEETKVTVVFVTHNIEEAVLTADRIAVLTPGPGRLKRLLVNSLPRPRSPEMPGFADLWEQLHGLLGLPRQAAQPLSRAGAPLSPLPGPIPLPPLSGQLTREQLQA
ncbi:MAG: ABC transporter ATP-binding protein [Chitinophagales bacterium]